MATINWLEYIADNNPDGIEDVLFRNGYNPTTYEDLHIMLQELINDADESIIEDLLMQHPEFDVIAEISRTNTNKENPQPENIQPITRNLQPEIQASQTGIKKIETLLTISIIIIIAIIAFKK